MADTETQVDRQAEAKRLSEVITGFIQQIDTLSPQVQTLVAQATDAETRIRKAKEDEEQQQKDHEASQLKREQEKQALEDKITTLSTTATTLEASNKTTSENLAKTTAAESASRENVANLETQSKVLSEGNYPLIVAAATHLESIQEMTAQEKMRLDNFIAQRGQINKELDERHDVVVAEENRVAEQTKKLNALKTEMRLKFPDQYIEV